MPDDMEVPARGSLARGSLAQWYEAAGVWTGVRRVFQDDTQAGKVYCDEGYHALCSLDLADQIAAATGIPIPDWDYGGLVDGLADSGRRLLPDEPRLAALLQVVVFETLITVVLNELPQDQSVVTTVREVMRDHAKDEGRHHRFFAAHGLLPPVSPGCSSTGR